MTAIQQQLPHQIAESAGFKLPHLTMLSFGAGQDSTYILYRILNDRRFYDEYVGDSKLIVSISDTGNEHRETYQHLQYVKRMLAQTNIPLFHLTPDMGFHNPQWYGLKEFYKLKNAIGSKAFPKTCTDKLKVQVIYKFLEDWLGQHYGVSVGRKKGLYEYTELMGQKLRVMIGIGADEDSRVGASDGLPVWMMRNIQRVYPMVDHGADRKEAQRYIKSLGHPVPPPSNCMLCPFLSDKELLWLHYNEPQEFDEWVALEQAKLDANAHKEKKNLTVWGNHKTLPMVLQEAKKKYKNLSMDDLNTHKMSHGHCVKSKY